MSGLNYGEISGPHAAVGRLIYYRPPAETDNVRVDTGVYEGGEISMFYDPMIAKLITHGKDRADAISRMSAALDQFVIRGVTSNLSFLSALMAHEKFASGDISTNTIAAEYPEGFDAAAAAPEDPSTMVVVAAAMMRSYRDRAALLEGQMDGHGRSVPDDWVVIMHGEHHPVTVVPTDGGHDVRYEGSDYAVQSDWQFGDHLYSGTINNVAVSVQIHRDNQKYRLLHGGHQCDLSILTPREAELMKLMIEKEPPDVSRHLLAPMPGLLISIAVKEGDEVKAGEELAVLEAMKMENTLRAERNGIVAKVHFEAGASIEVDELIMELE